MNVFCFLLAYGVKISDIKLLKAGMLMVVVVFVCGCLFYSMYFIVVYLVFKCRLTGVSLRPGHRANGSSMNTTLWGCFKHLNQLFQLKGDIQVNYPAQVYQPPTTVTTTLFYPYRALQLKWHKTYNAPAHLFRILMKPLG